MDDFWRGHVPAFGSWDCNDDLPFTQCFESARQAGLLRYSYSEDRDLYVAGDLYQNDVVTPAMIFVPRRRAKAARQPQVAKEAKKEANWVVCNSKDTPSPVASPPPPPPQPRKAPKAVDEDLYKISPELLYAKSKRRGGWGFFPSCLIPSCANS
ncbi:uncharacterized protein LOC127814071 isoform X2 [Diospyros lotus]|uniref:uncharacterized protein LOC127814071 isoform X2 n=1 Tax=Diospyros lotus TaxID=55363 RepID=UPI0022504EC1|nr:uncharacterized protein LOC127814071 isoform X2 [Diospyros lotus]